MKPSPKPMKTLPLAVMALIAMSTLASAGGKSAAAERARREAKQERLEKAQARQAEAKQEAMRTHIKQATAMQFEHKNSDADLLRGKLTYAVPAKDGDGYTAYLHIQWGDLDKLITKNSAAYYSNWDGSVKLQQAGTCSVVKEFAFDDRNGTIGGVEEKDGLGRDSGRKDAVPGESGAGSGRDTLIRDDDHSIVAWKSGVVGATDGLLIRLDLKKPETRGVLEIGNFTVPFTTELRRK